MFQKCNGMEDLKCMNSLNPSLIHPWTSVMVSIMFVLVLAGIELIFFLVAGTVLGFGFRVRIMLITC